MTDIKKHIKIADAFGKDTKELDEGFVDWVTSTVQKVLGIDDAKADQIAGELRGDMSPAEIKAADEATSGAEQKALTKDQKDAIAGRGEYKPQDQDGGVTQGIDQADQATGANAQGGGEGGAPQNDGSVDAVGSEEDPGTATDQDGGVTQGIDQADQAMGANAQGGGEGGAPTGNAGSNLAGKLDTKTANLMKAYNDGGKQAMPAIRDLQIALGRLDHDPNGIDGKYGQGTYNAVAAFQKANGLTVDGQAGPNTMKKIQELLQGQKPKDADATARQDTTNQAAADKAMDAGNANFADDPQATDQGTEQVPSRLRIRQVIAPEIEKLLKMAAESVQGMTHYRFIVENRAIAEKLDPPQLAQLQKYLDQIRASAKRDPEVRKEFGDLIKRMEKALNLPSASQQAADTYAGGDAKGGEFANDPQATVDPGLQNKRGFDPNAKKGVDGPADDTAAKNQAAADDAQKQGDATYANDPQATVDPGLQNKRGFDPNADTRDGDDLGTAPTAPKVSKEVHIQSTGQSTNFNVKDMKKKYPKPFVEIPQTDGTVIRGYGQPQALDIFIKNNKGAKIIGAPKANTQQSGAPDANADAKERGVQVAEKETNMKKQVKEASMNISMNGSSSAEVAELIAILKNAGMESNIPHMHAEPDMPEPPMGDSPCGMGEEAVDEEWDNSPEETYADHHTMTKDLSGGINREKPKGAIRAKDPAVHQTVESSIREQLWAALNEKFDESKKNRGKKNRGMEEGSRGNKKKNRGMEEGSRGNKKKNRGMEEASRGNKKKNRGMEEASRGNKKKSRG